MKSRLTFGILVDWITGCSDDANYYQTNIIAGVEDFTKENDINLVCLLTGRLDSPNEWERSRNIMFDFATRETIDGLIVLTGSIGTCGTRERMLELLQKYQNIPIVTMNDGLEAYPSVSINNYTGMRQIVDHLIDIHGCRQIAFIGGSAANPEAQVRFAAYQDSLTSHQLIFNALLVYQGDFMFESGKQGIKVLLEDRKAQFDAVVAASDLMAIGALTELSKRTDQMAGSLPVAGFDDTDAGRGFSLTTVRQSFYSQARRAANLLLRIIRGESVPAKDELPSEMVIRSSCGCISPLVINAFIGKFQLSTEPFEAGFQGNRDRILAELFNINQTIGLNLQPVVDQNQLLDHEQKVLDALADEIRTGKNGFINAWNSLILWFVLKKINLFSLQDILSVLRRNILAILSKQPEIIIVEDLLQAARVQTGESIHKAVVASTVFPVTETDSLDYFGEELISTLDYNNQMEFIYRKLPGLDIHQCYICLYEDHQHPLAYSRLILGFKENKRFQTDINGLRFPTLDLLPESVMKHLQKSRYSLIFQALHQGDHQLGFVIFTNDLRLKKKFEIIRYHLSVALKGASLIEEIKNQTLDLERQIVKRTRDLSQTNKQLQKEIIKREKVEKKLKEALKDLEVYNKKLHHQSLRDELTGLYNRRGFMTLGTQYYEYAINMKKGFLILFADLDGLKQINDRYGHPEGDWAIVKTAEIFNQSFREMDIIARIGGDEFTVLVSGALPQDEAYIINRLYRLFGLNNKEYHKSYNLSISIGATYFDPESSCSFEELLQKADQTLYSEKQRKKKLINALT